MGPIGVTIRLVISADVWCRLVKDFCCLFSVVAGQSRTIDEHRSGSKYISPLYRARRETKELLATVSLGLFIETERLGPTTFVNAEVITDDSTNSNVESHPTRPER